MLLFKINTTTHNHNHHCHHPHSSLLSPPPSSLLFPFPLPFPSSSSLSLLFTPSPGPPPFFSIWSRSDPDQGLWSRPHCDQKVATFWSQSGRNQRRTEEHTSELTSRTNPVFRLSLAKKKTIIFFRRLTNWPLSLPNTRKNLPSSKWISAFSSQ